MLRVALLIIALVAAVSSPAAGLDGTPLFDSQMIFPLEHWHNHASCIVEAPDGELIVCWFHGSGERTADDVKIEGARKRTGMASWGARFTMADTPGYPDTNCAMFIDPQGRLWLMWPTILANQWETALMKYKISSDYHQQGAPKWDTAEILHVTPGKEFEAGVAEYLARSEASLAKSNPSEETRRRVQAYFDNMRAHASDKFYRRLGWMTRAHPFVLEGKRLIVPLYSDGFSFSLMAITDDWGQTWHTSTPLIGGGNIQPSIAQRRDGTLYTLMRDNGLPPKRLQQSESRDRGETWSPVTDTDLPNPGSGAEVINLKNGHWLLVGNDLEQGRFSLAVWISEDEGRTWRWKRHLEIDHLENNPGSFSYPSVIQAMDGTLHVTYSYHLNKKTLPNDLDGEPARKSIKYAHFNEAWVQAGD